MEAINIKAYTKSSAQVEALKAFMKALKIKFEVLHTIQSLLKKILQGDKDFTGKGRKITIAELDKLWK